MAFQPPRFARLSEALSAQGQVDVNYTISNALQEMFRTKFPIDLDYGDRLERAQTIHNNLNAHTVVFYSLRHLDENLAAYQAQKEHVKNQIRTAVIGNAATLSNINTLREVFIEQRTPLLQAQGMLDEEQQIQLNLYNYYIDTPLKINTLHSAALNASNQAQSINTWFNDQYLEIADVAESNFYQISDVDAAKAEGRIYHPGLVSHNWGVNCAWLLSFIRRRIDVLVLSPLTLEYGTRHNRSGPPPHPSALALELATALTAGYMLNYDAATNTIRLTAPHGVTVTNQDDINGTEGVGLLQTRQAQLDIYNYIRQYVKHKRGIGENIENWIPEPIIAHATTNRLLAFASNPIAPSAMLVAITQNPHANAAVLDLVRRHQNGNNNINVLTAIANNPNATTVQLDALAHFPHASPDMLVAIAKNPNVNVSILQMVVHAVANHPNIDTHTTLHPILEEITHNPGNIQALQEVANSPNTLSTSAISTAKEMLRLLLSGNDPFLPIVEENEEIQRNPFRMDR